MFSVWMTPSSSGRYKSSTCILNKPPSRALPMSYAPSAFAKPFKAPQQVHPPRPSAGYILAKGYTDTRRTNTEPDVDMDAPPTAGPSRVQSPFAIPSSIGKAVRADSFYGPPKPKGDKIVIEGKSKKKRMEWGGALHDPRAEGAVVMQRPPDKEAQRR